MKEYNTPGGEKRIAIERPVWSVEEVLAANRRLIATPHALKHFEDKRGLKEDTIQKFMLGFVSHLQALTVPVYKEDGTLFNVRFHSIRSKKKWGLAGKTTMYLYDHRNFDWDANEVWIVEGEPDLWVAHKLGLNAITGTGGAGVIHSIINDRIDGFKDKKIYLVMDNDTAGTEAAAKLRALFDSEHKVFKIKWPINAPYGYDLCDWYKNAKELNDEPKDMLKQMIEPFSLSDAMVHVKLSEEFYGELENNPIYINGAEYWRKVQKGMATRLSSFLLKPKMRLVNVLGNEVNSDILVADVVCGNTTYPNIFIPKEAFSSKKSFQRNMPSTEMSFRGSDTDLQDLMEFVAGNKRPIPKKHAVDHFGIIPSFDAWISPNCVIGRKGFVDNPDVIALPQGTVMEDRIQPVNAGEEEKQKLLSKMMDLIPKVHSPECAMTTWAWMTACFLKPWFQPYKLGGFPILNIFGTAGGGKTSIATMFYRMFGYTESEPFSARMTPFSVMKLLSVSTTVPLIVDEFKYDLPREVIDFWRNKTRSIYTGESDFRGTKELTLVQYKSRAPLVICGEVALSSEKALFERVIPASPSPFWLQSESGHTAKKVFEELKNVNLEAFPGYFVPWLLANRKDIMGKMMLNAVKYITVLTGKNRLPIRIEKNMAVVKLGIDVIRKFFAENLEGVDLTEFDLKCEKAIRWIVSEMSTLDSFGRSKMAMDELVECFAVMAMTNRLACDVHYTMGSLQEGVVRLDDIRGEFPRYVYIHFASAFPEFCKWARETQYRGEILDKNAYYRQMRECADNKEYIVDLNRNKRFVEDAAGAVVKRTLMIDLYKASKMGLEVDGFGVPSGKISAHVSSGGELNDDEENAFGIPEEYTYAEETGNECVEEYSYSEETAIDGGEDDIPF